MTQSARAEKMQARAAKMQARADKLRQKSTVPTDNRSQNSAPSEAPEDPK
ncbi:MAG: hypothetical protein J1F39_05105 [Clostridiales bacterium]|nr:hypothetical protein [Clostridiales bacterium]